MISVWATVCQHRSHRCSYIAKYKLKLASCKTLSSCLVYMKPHAQIASSKGTLTTRILTCEELFHNSDLIIVTQLFSNSTYIYMHITHVYENYNLISAIRFLFHHFYIINKPHNHTIEPVNI